jgi:hypothetical protein
MNFGSLGDASILNIGIYRGKDIIAKLKMHLMGINAGVKRKLKWYLSISSQILLCLR